MKAQRHAPRTDVAPRPTPAVAPAPIAAADAPAQAPVSETPTLDNADFSWSMEQSDALFGLSPTPSAQASEGPEVPEAEDEEEAPEIVEVPDVEQASDEDDGDDDGSADVSLAPDELTVAVASAPDVTAHPNGATTTDTETTTGELTVADGRIGVGVTGTQRSATTRPVQPEEADGADEETTSSTAVTVHGGAGIGRDGVDANAGFNTAIQEGETTSTFGAAGSAGVGRTGARASGAASAGVSHGPVKVTGSLGASGSFSIEVTPIEGTAPVQYKLVLTLRVGGKVGAGGELGTDDNHISVGATADASKTLVFERKLLDAEVQQYIASAQAVAAGGAVPGAAREFDIMSRAALGRDALDQLNEAVLTDPHAVDGMADGSSLEMTIEGGASGALGGQVGAAGISAGVESSTGHHETFKLKVAREKHDGLDRVTITVTEETKDERSLSGNASLEVGAAASASESTASGRSIEIRLDHNARNFDESFARVKNARTREEFEALAREFRGTLTITDSDEDELGGGVGRIDDGEVSEGLSRTERHRRSREIVYGWDEDGNPTVSGTVRGGSEDDLDASVHGLAILSSQDHTSATAAVDERGRASLDVDHSNETGVSALPDWLEEVLNLQATSMDKWHVTENGLEALSQRAKNVTAWLNYMDGRDMRDRAAVEAWLALASRLASPALDGKISAINPVVARRVALSEAITRYTGSANAGIVARSLDGALNNTAGERLATHVYWPDALEDAHREFDDTKGKIDTAVEQWPAIVDRDERTKMQGHLFLFRRHLTNVLQAIDTSGDYPDSMTQLDTEDLVRDERLRVDTLEKETLARTAVLMDQWFNGQYTYDEGEAGLTGDAGAPSAEFLASEQEQGNYLFTEPSEPTADEVAERERRAPQTFSYDESVEDQYSFDDDEAVNGPEDAEMTNTEHLAAVHRRSAERRATERALEQPSDAAPASAGFSWTFDDAENDEIDAAAPPKAGRHHRGRPAPAAAPARTEADEAEVGRQMQEYLAAITRAVTFQSRQGGDFARARALISAGDGEGAAHVLDGMSGMIREWVGTIRRVHAYQAALTLDAVDPATPDVDTRVSLLHQAARLSSAIGVGRAEDHYRSESRG